MQTTKTKQYKEVINRPSEGWTAPDLREVWQHRTVLYSLTARQLRARYKQTVLGLSWAFLNPIVTMLVMSFVFGRLARVSSYGVPYPIFNFTALVPWTLFSKGLMASSTSIVSESTLVTKIYLPRLITPMSMLFTGLVDFFLSLIVLFIMMAAYGFTPTIRIIWLPFFTLLALAAAFGVSLWLSALHVRFRDIGQIVPFMVQIWMYLSPVAYPSDLLKGTERIIYGLNPIVTVCDGFRWALLDIDAFNAETAAASVLSTLIVLVAGLFFFRRMESSFPDLI
jgi:lipopolysaccharide transport system permease protein